MRYASLCDGIGAVHCAWQALGWECAWTSEIEKFPMAVVEARHPGISNLGDMLAITESMLDEHERPDLVVAGTPCQSFSVAGLRGGLDDPRGNLALRFIQLVGVLQPTWVVWENVPGVLSSNRGRDFGTILGALAQLGYGFAYRVLDAQYFGGPQRRRRVFVVGCSRGWQRAAAVLLEQHCLRGDPPTREAKESRVARSITASTGGASAKEQQHTFIDGDGEPLNALSSWWDGGQLSQTLDAVLSKGQTMPEKNRFPAVLEPVAFKASHYTRGKDGAPSQVVAPLSADADKGDQDTLIAHTSDGVVADPITTTEGKSWTNESSTFRLRNCVQQPMAVRRLTPRECERLQGFPDDYTLIPWRRKPAWDCPDGPRYRALGNSMAVPVMRWIGERILAVDSIP
jgi:DNA (cytosine-5)-methyltransferase 1